MKQYQAQACRDLMKIIARQRAHCSFLLRMTLINQISCLHRIKRQIEEDIFCLAKGVDKKMNQGELGLQVSVKITMKYLVHQVPSVERVHKVFEVRILLLPPMLIYKCSRQPLLWDQEQSTKPREVPLDLNLKNSNLLVNLQHQVRILNHWYKIDTKTSMQFSKTNSRQVHFQALLSTTDHQLQKQKGLMTMLSRKPLQLQI